VLDWDDPRVAALADLARVPVRWFGVAGSLRTIFRSDDELHAEPGPQVEPPSRPADVELLTYAPGRSVYRVGDQTLDVALRAEGAHNAQNAAAVIAAAVGAGLAPAEVAERLAAVPPAFGRGESVSVRGRTVVLQLAKNPGGFRLALLSQQEQPADVSVVAINDEYADSRDVSWLWDVDFTPLRSTRGPVLTAGTRAADMALRLAYDEVPVEGMVPDVVAAVEQAVDAAPDGGRVVVYTTYTAMWRLHEVLGERPGVVHPGRQRGRRGLRAAGAAS
jgi:lipid II isoglutaminyl synthase (glutamine-hydrolysing)